MFLEENHITAYDGGTGGIWVAQYHRDFWGHSWDMQSEMKILGKFRVPWSCERRRGTVATGDHQEEKTDTRSGWREERVAWLEEWASEQPDREAWEVILEDIDIVLLCLGHLVSLMFSIPTGFYVLFTSSSSEFPKPWEERFNGIISLRNMHIS